MEDSNPVFNIDCQNSECDGEFEAKWLRSEERWNLHIYRCTDKSCDEEMPLLSFKRDESGEFVIYMRKGTDRCTINDEDWTRVDKSRNINTDSLD